MEKGIFVIAALSRQKFRKLDNVMHEIHDEVFPAEDVYFTNWRLNESRQINCNHCSSCIARAFR